LFCARRIGAAATLCVVKSIAFDRLRPAHWMRRSGWALPGWITVPWPLPAVVTWVLAWGFFLTLRRAGLDAAAAWLLAAGPSALVALSQRRPWRRLMVAAGFPLSSLALGAAVPTWAWLVALVPLLLAYPLRAWSDAPFFPTPRHALQALAAAVPLPSGASVLDAGCGLGHGLNALRATWPRAQLHGVEWSAPLAWLCARRCKSAQVLRGDMWVLPWAGHDVVYLFQRPESMRRAWTKACAEMQPGHWLVSLEFAIPDVQPHAQLDAGGGRPLWVYRVPSSATSGSKKPRHGR
jgi:hypothetical protein